MIKIKNIRKEIDCFEYTENFDGYCIFNNKNLYFNLKFITDAGGSQTRSITQVYHFIKIQNQFIKNKENLFFINILDGNCCFNNIKYLKFLNPDKNIFIGSTFEFQTFLTENLQRNILN